MRWVVLAVALAGCGSEPQTFGDGVDCGGIACPTGTVCCLGSTTGLTCETSCVERAVVRCDEPSDCGSQYCCAQTTLLPAPSSEPNCRITGQLTCASSCTSGRNGSGCSGMIVQRICTTSADCAGDPAHANCCGSGTILSCVDDAERSRSGLCR